MSYEKIVVDHYQDQASKLGLSAASTMPDESVRKTELEVFANVLPIIAQKNSSILEIGCGNGVLLAEMEKWGYTNVEGMDYVEEFVELANSRGLSYPVKKGDIKSLNYLDNSFDIILSERVIINLMDENDQRQAFDELSRILKPGGFLVCFEGFKTPLKNLNQARKEFDLVEIPMAKQNLWFCDKFFDEIVDKYFKIINTDESDFPSSRILSNHYFMTRVFHAVMESASNLKEEGKRNTLFSVFFSQLACQSPPIGDFSPVKFYLLEKL